MNYFIQPLYRNRVSITTREIKAISIIRGQLLGQIYASDVFSRFGAPKRLNGTWWQSNYTTLLFAWSRHWGSGYFEEMVVIISIFRGYRLFRPKMTATYLYLTFNNHNVISSILIYLYFNFTSLWRYRVNFNVFLNIII